MTLSVGDSTHLSKTIREVDVTVYAAISLDANPIHLDEEYARQTPFGRRIAQGMLSAGLISACIGTQLPGPGSIYLSQDLRFRKPVYLDDTITATVEVVALEDRGRVRLRTTCTNQTGEVVLDGEAVVLPPRAKEIT
ncbi:MAG: MaoC family dehydratase [Phycicoccus sp.]|nr:MaoC family dehydratase [Phycicoccus sp.]NMM34334.1 MaoC family dehydratase [Phycicoccus sp.]